MSFRRPSACGRRRYIISRVCSLDLSVKRSSPCLIFLKLSLVALFPATLPRSFNIFLSSRFLLYNRYLTKDLSRRRPCLQELVPAE
ncbi:uncharacterized protein BT62DRAFT_183401 [Guyanagaster necrorhizus]|uniref:Uncharacterized protein n=1 Tax=Guyanagaster necrorhizus TaxID=856835 RepID=A0A9P8ARA6_9AGAR|nr:uncharacterized protein BT62DRAFT_183401 [Guyanagaster necrorhizus MCA 3950]KAG7445203.1 hypothetical protein BT62DRAFT_183401 [Guyanagaster necrorhizus MCA 3950]